MSVLANLMVKLGLDSKEFKKGIGDAKQKTSTFGNAMKKVGGMIAGAFAVQKIISFGQELINLSGIAEGVRDAFDRMADDSTLKDLQRATVGTVGELELMKRAVSAQNLGVPIENLASLFEFATKRAQDTGESVDYLVNSIVVGIGRKSPLILDNLGISAIQLKEKLNGVAIGVASTADVAKAVGEIASDSMRESGKIIDSNSIKVANLKTQWEDFKLSIAESPKFKETISNNLNELKDNFEVFFSDNLTGWEKFLAITDVTNRNMTKMAEKSKRITEEQSKLNQVNKDSVSFYEKGIASVTKKDKIEEKHTDTIAELKGQIKSLIESVDLYNISQGDEIQQTLREIETINKLIESLTTLKVAREKINETPLIETITDNVKVKSNQTPIKLETSDLYDWGDSQVEKAYEMYNRYFANWNAFKQDMAYSIADFGTNVVGEMGAAFGELAKTGEFPEDFGKNVLSIIGGFISELGKMLIGLGIASEAFTKLLASSFMLGGLPAIAAGVGLVLLGGAIQGFAKAGPTGSSSGSVSTPQSYSSAGSTQASSNNANRKVVFEIEGTTLKGVLNNIDRKYSLIR